MFVAAFGGEILMLPLFEVIDPLLVMLPEPTARLSEPALLMVPALFRSPVVVILRFKLPSGVFISPEGSTSDMSPCACTVMLLACRFTVLIAGLNEARYKLPLSVILPGKFSVPDLVRSITDTFWGITRLLII